MRVLVCGGRDFTDAAFLNAALDRLHAEHGFTVLIEGRAEGADQLAGAWADSRGITHVEFPADWARYGTKAGPKRNRQMLDEGKPGLVVAFPGSHGTADMVRIARAAGVTVIEIAPRGLNESQPAYLSTSVG